MEVIVNEKAIIEAAQKDPEHFTELYENHFERIYAQDACAPKTLLTDRTSVVAEHFLLLCIMVQAAQL